MVSAGGLTKVSQVLGDYFEDIPPEAVSIIHLLQVG